jgi:transcriptional adapter 3
MAALTPYTTPPPLRSALFRSNSEAVPPTDDLETLHKELSVWKQRALERARKAGEDARFIEESVRRIKEREKGKAKAVDRIKKERARA